jgi:tRNA threonylcarbamoyl adenosine modification protein YeaZ
MKILALELSSPRGSLAFLSDDVQVAREWPNDRKNSALFFQHLSEVQNGFGRADVIIVGLGPGSYAGTRIAISAAIGLQVATSARLVGLASICAMQSAKPEYCVIGDARRQTFFLARIRDHEVLEGPILMSESELRARLKNTHKDTPLFSSEELTQFGAAIRYPSARILASLARKANRSFILSPLEPIYLRDPHITIPKPIPS